VVNLLYGTGDGAKRHVQTFGQHAPGWGQDQALVMAHKHGFAQPVFQLLDLAADGALCDMELVASPGEASGADGGVKSAQGVEWGQAFHETGLYKEFGSVGRSSRTGRSGTMAVFLICHHFLWVFSEFQGDTVFSSFPGGCTCRANFPRIIQCHDGA
jgi:hypothetical protein